MKLSEQTVTVLKNFSTINPSILFREGNEVTTMSPQKTIVARYKSAESFERDFGIYEVNRFLGTLSLFEDPELNLDSNFMTVKTENASSNYFYAAPEMIVSPEAQVFERLDGAVKAKEVLTVNLSDKDLKQVMNGASVLQLPDITVEVEEGKILLVARDVKNKGSNTFKQVVGTTDKEFDNLQVIFRAENMKLLPTNYTVTISESGLCHFSSDSGVIEYWIAVESTSTYN